MKKIVRLLALLLTFLFCAQTVLAAEKITVAAAADLKFALDEVVHRFRQDNPGATVDLIYGSSGKFHAQIQQGAPYDLFFSADIAYPRALQDAGLAASEARPYALGRLVLWRRGSAGVPPVLDELATPEIRKVAIANPRHAPYGKRAEEALRASGLWAQVEAKLVLGENVAQAAQFVQTGNAQAGIIALSLALGPELSRSGRYTLLPEHLHQPLEQGFIITRRAAGNSLAQRFAAFVQEPAARRTFERYGFVLPGEVR